MCEIWLDDGGFLTTISPGKTAERTRAQWQTSIQAIKAIHFSNSPFYRKFKHLSLSQPSAERSADSPIRIRFGLSSTCSPHGCVPRRLHSRGAAIHTCASICCVPRRLHSRGAAIHTCASILPVWATTPLNSRFENCLAATSSPRLLQLRRHPQSQGYLLCWSRAKSSPAIRCGPPRVLPVL